MEDPRCLKVKFVARCPRNGRTSEKETLWTGGWVCPRAGLEWSKKSRPTGIRSPDRPARS